MKATLIAVLVVIFAFGNIATAEENRSSKKIIEEKYCIEIPYGRNNHPERIEVAIFEVMNLIPIELAPIFWNPTKLKKRIGEYTTEVCETVRIIPLD